MFKKVLLPIDINHPESWEKALPLALQCAGGEGEVHLLGIVHDLGANVVASFLPEDFEKQAMERLKAQLVEFADGNLAGKVTNQVHVGHGAVAQTILRHARDLGADLIVIASHMPNDFQTLLVGSNADRVVRHAEIPVLVVR
jgi:nucleotide-binding universal stress UspA family protein